MILEQILNGLKNIILWFINLMPDIDFTMPDVTGLNNAVKILFYFLTKPVTIAVLTSTLFWLTVQPTVSLIKFVYRKIPGVS